ncbi:hypothetical protein Tco_0143924 [Tanacetum coccineum]
MAAVNDVPQLVDKKEDDIMESVISCFSSKETWTDLVHSFEGPLNTKENRIIDLKLEYQTFRAKSIENPHRPTPAIIPCSMSLQVMVLNSLNMKSIYLWEDFQENSDEVDERTSEEYLRDLDIEYHERVLLANSKRFIKRRNNFSGQKANENTECYKCGNKVSKGFQPKFTSKLIQSSSNSNSQADPKFQKEYKVEYKKMKAKFALLKVYDKEEVTHVKVLMALADDELTVGKSHTRNGEWVDITIRNVNTLLFMDEDADLQNYLKYINIDLKFVEEQRLNLLSKTTVQALSCFLQHGEDRGEGNVIANVADGEDPLTVTTAVDNSEDPKEDPFAF